MKKCDVCGNNVNVLWHSRRTDKNTGKVIRPSRCHNCKNRQEIKSTSSKKIMEQKKDLNIFFADASLVFPLHCENCGHRLINTGSFTRRSQTCHIIPKSKFKSVATHPANKVFMCCFDGCYGHGNWDNLDAEKRKTMPVYYLATERFREFEHLLTESEKLKAIKYLGL